MTEQTIRPELNKALTIRPLTDYSQIEELYLTRLKNDFARDERRPLSAIRRLWRKKLYECYALFEKETIQGYAFFVHRGRDYLFDYLAVAEERRAEGLGSCFLHQLASCLRDAGCIVGEVEDPDRAENEEDRSLRERRLQFYLRSGYRKTEVTSTVFGVNYRILELPASRTHTAEEIRTVYTALYRETMPAWFLRTQFRITNPNP